MGAHCKVGLSKSDAGLWMDEFAKKKHGTSLAHIAACKFTRRMMHGWFHQPANAAAVLPRDSELSALRRPSRLRLLTRGDPVAQAVLRPTEIPRYIPSTPASITVVFSHLSSFRRPLSDFPHTLMTTSRPAMSCGLVPFTA